VRLLWYVRKYMDTSLDSTTWTSMVRALSAAHTVHLVSGYRRHPDDLGLGGLVSYIPSVNLPVLNLLSFATWAALRMPIDAASMKADVVVVDPSLVTAAIPAIALSRLARRRRVFILDVRTIPVDSGSWRDWTERAWFRLNVRLAGTLLDGITVITDPMAEIVSRMAGVARDRIGTWSSGVDFSLFSPPARSVPKSEGCCLRIIYHGAILATRGLPQAVEAVRMLRDMGDPPSLRIVGSGPDVALLQRRVAELGLSSLISIEPPVPPEDVPLLLSDSDVGLVPFPDLECWRVSSPLKMLEYMAMGMPVVATSLPCNLIAARASEGVVWVANASAETIADGMREAQRRLPELALAARDARAGVVAEYSWGTQARRLVAYATSVLRERYP
jgi:glycosyltransferase involved in cell wall biosynthesis